MAACLPAGRLAFYLLVRSAGSVHGLGVFFWSALWLCTHGPTSRLWHRPLFPSLWCLQEVRLVGLWLRLHAHLLLALPPVAWALTFALALLWLCHSSSHRPPQRGAADP